MPYRHRPLRETALLTPVYAMILIAILPMLYALLRNGIECIGSELGHAGIITSADVTAVHLAVKATVASGFL